MTGKEKDILTDLGKKVRDLAAKDVNKERKQRIIDMHNLKAVRPPVWIDEIPWHEMNMEDSLTLQCESTEAREMEQHFRRILYRWKYIQADMVVEDTYYITKAYEDSGFGLTIKDETIATHKDNYIVSHAYEDQLDEDEKVDALYLPKITVFPETDKKNLEMANDVLDGIMDVKLRGHMIYYAPWDQIARFRGVENIYIDMISNPDLLHRIMKKFTAIYDARYDQLQEAGLLEFNLSHLHCTPSYSDKVPAPDYDGGKIRYKDVWFRGMAQMFGSASPAMHDEFSLEYLRPMMDKCALVYYGCCEPLDNFIPYLKKVPNMRKIGVSPWANIRSSAEQMGSNYVYAHKPNPANVARDFIKETVVTEISNVIEACMENKCAYEFTLKDISTVNHDPRNLIMWTETVKETIDKYYK